MLVIQDILVSDEVVAEEFACNLTACKGACCWEGDFGAPLEVAELVTLAAIYPYVAPYLRPEGRAAIEEQGPYTKTKDNHGPATTLVNGGACAYMTRNEHGIALCGIEQAYRAGDIDWPKPISCHLYPIRVKQSEKMGFEALNYDRWHICSPACKKGKRDKVKVYEFAKEALIRKFGPDWYDELDAAAKYKAQEEKKDRRS
ncbi:MAG: DUF3109 family protein [Bacteroidota bacterium]